MSNHNNLTENQEFPYPFSRLSPALKDNISNINSITSLGAIPDGKTDCSDIINNATSALTFPSGEYYIQKNITINSYTFFLPGAILNFASGITVKFKKIITASPEQEIFNLNNFRTNIISPNKTFSLGWFVGASNGNIDIGAITSMIIAGADYTGRKIIFPNGRYRAETPILLNGKNFISLEGPGPAMRSNIDYSSAPTYAGGGALIEVAGNAGIHDAIPEGHFPRTSGFSVRGLSFSGQLGGPIKQTGILLERNGDGAVIENCTFISFNGGSGSCCVNLFAQDTAALRNCWLAESSNGLAIGNGKEISILGCKIGAQPNGISINISNSVRCIINNNNIFPDGFTNINISGSQFCTISNNIISSRFIGLIVGSHINGCTITGNTLRAPNDLETHWTARDPQNRDTNYGLIMLNGLCDNTMISDNFIWAYPAVETKPPCGIRIQAGGSGNSIENNKFSGNEIFIKSSSLIVIEHDDGHSGKTYLLDSCTSEQAFISGAVSTRYLPS